jgi:type I restriction enzyme S subunit
MNKNNKIFPKLRFPEFTNDAGWEITTIGDLGSFYYGKSAPKWSLAEDAPTPCVRYGELYSKFDAIISDVTSRTNIDSKNLRFSKGGEILIPRVGEIAIDFAKNCSYLPLANIAIGEMISVFETKENPLFYTYYFRTLWKEFATVVEGQNVKNLYYVNLEPLVICKPQVPEQQKIAECLSSLDELIAASAEKLDALKEHKKGLMQNLFPAEGELTPKLRFPEFANGGEWEEKPLRTLAKKIVDKNIDGLITDVFTNSAIDGIVDQREYFDKDIANKNNLNNYFIVDIGDYVYNPRISNIAPVGPISKNKTMRKGAMSPLYTVFRFYNIKNEFFEYYFKSNHWYTSIKKAANTGARFDRMSITDSSFMDIPVLSPEQPEQQKIAECLSSLDEIIERQGELIDALKKHKRGLMQGLFPAPSGE